MTPLEDAVTTSRKLALKTKRLYEGRVRQYLTFCATNGYPWDQTLSLEAWRDTLLADARSPETVDVYMNAITFASRRAAQRFNTPDFASVAERPRKVEAEPTEGKLDALSVEECARLIAACEGPHPADRRDHAMVLLALHAAYRREELCDLEIERVTHGTTTVMVKGRRWHTVRVGGQAWEALRGWISWLGRHEVKEGRVFRSVRQGIGPGSWHIGAKLTGDGVYKALGARAKAAGIPTFHPHRLRHTFVTRAREAGWPDWQIRQVTGQRSVQMLDRYTSDVGTEALGELVFPRFGE